MLDDLPPRRYCDCTVPVRTDGSALTRCIDWVDMRHYAVWLSKYLYEVEIPLTPEEEQWIASQPSKPSIFGISLDYGKNLLPLEDVEDAFAKGAVLYESYMQEVRNTWKRRYPTPESQAENPFEWLYGLSRETFSRLLKEWKEWKASGDESNHADIPFRPLLAHLIKQIHYSGHQERAIDNYLLYVTELYGESWEKAEE